MAFFEWRPEFSVGISKIDEQHKKLIDMMSLLHEAVESKSELKELAAQYGVLDDMADYTQYHFGTEEAYMCEHTFPGYEKHKKEHELFVERVRELRQLFHVHGKSRPVDVLRFLKEWLRNHIMVSDKGYGPFLKEKGVE